jgi:hypothetical protein
MDLISAFKSEVLRPIVTLVIPGATAIAPWVIVVSYYIPKVAEFWKNHPTAFVAIITACVLSAGLILEDIGASIETFIWNRVADEATKQEWDKYLKLQLKDEIVGQRYLQTILMRLKFELSMPPALVVFAMGLLWIEGLYDTGSGKATLSLSGIVFGIAVYLFYEAIQSVQLLANTRRLIIESIEENPIVTKADKKE